MLITCNLNKTIFSTGSGNDGYTQKYECKANNSNSFHNSSQITLGMKIFTAIYLIYSNFFNVFF